MWRRSMIICGIDPGLSGGIAFYRNVSYDLYAEKVPTYKLQTRTKTKRFLDLWQLLTILNDHDPDHVFIEKQQPMPNQGLVSTFATGMGYGAYLGLLVATGYNYTEVPARVWKKDLNCPSDKDQSRDLASKLMPQGKHLWQLKSQDGIAEASLIAYWGLRKSIERCKDV